MLRGTDVNELLEFQRDGLSIQAISELTGYDRKTVRKYLLDPEVAPEYGPRATADSKLDHFKPFLTGRLKDGVWNGKVLLRELRQRGYGGGYTILKDWLQPQREAAHAAAVRRFETAPGQQAQADWGHLGYLHVADRPPQRIWGFAITLCYSRRMWAQAALDQKLGTLLKMHEGAFQQWGAVPEEILYDRMRTIWSGTDERGEIVWNPVFLDFAKYWGFRPRLCKPYRAQTKGKIESGVKYSRRNFVCGLQGREPSCLMDFNTQYREWVETVANTRVHGTTHQNVGLLWDMDQFHMQPVAGRQPYPYQEDEVRKVARDAYVSWRASRYSVPWRFAGHEVLVREQQGQVEIHCGGHRIATHSCAQRRHQVITIGSHHEGIPLGPDRDGGKILVHIRETAPSVETRTLAAYEGLAEMGASL